MEEEEEEAEEGEGEEAMSNEQKIHDRVFKYASSLIGSTHTCS